MAPPRNAKLSAKQGNPAGLGQEEQERRNLEPQSLGTGFFALYPFKWWTQKFSRRDTPPLLVPHATTELLCPPLAFLTRRPPSFLHAHAHWA